MSEKSFESNLARSNKTIKAIDENPSKFRMLTGEKPL